MLQNATPLRKSAPGPPNSSDEHVSCTAPATENASLQILFKCPMPAIVFGNATKPSVLLTFDEVRNPLRLPRNTTSERPKVDGASGVFNVLTFEMCFAPQQRALFRHLNFKNCSDSEVFCAFWLRHVLRATMACNFSSLIWPAGSAPTALANLLFDPPEPQIIGKTQCFVTFLFAHLDLLSSETFSFLIFFLLLFSSLLWLFPPLLFNICPVWLLNFLRPWFSHEYLHLVQGNPHVFDDTRLRGSKSPAATPESSPWAPWVPLPPDAAPWTSHCRPPQATDLCSRCLPSKDGRVDTPPNRHVPMFLG